MMKKTIKVLHFTSYNEDCGIAKYQEQFINGMRSQVDLQHEVFDYSPYQIRRMTQEKKNQVAKQLTARMRHNDILHIQHEFGFYDGDELKQIIHNTHRLRKKIMVTMHTSPTYAYKPIRRDGIGPRSIVKYAREMKAYRAFLDTRFEPIKKADAVIVHNEATKKDLVKFGVKKEKVTVIRHPVRTVTDSRASTEVSQNLNKSPGDVLFAAIGFPSQRKGALDTIKALKYLPDNYKLAIIGGVHPTGENEPLIDKMCDLAVKLGVQDRVYITGFIKDDDYLNSLIREADVCVYPYVKAYYDHVSSGALNHAIGNNVPVVAYPTASFIEMNQDVPVVQFTKSFNYYELARALQLVDYAAAKKLTVEYAALYNWPQEAVKFSTQYRSLLAR